MSATGLWPSRSGRKQSFIREISRICAILNGPAADRNAHPSMHARQAERTRLARHDDGPAAAACRTARPHVGHLPAGARGARLAELLLAVPVGTLGRQPLRGGVALRGITPAGPLLG